MNFELPENARSCANPDCQVFYYGGEGFKCPNCDMPFVDCLTYGPRKVPTKIPPPTDDLMEDGNCIYECLSMFNGGGAKPEFVYQIARELNYENTVESLMYYLWGHGISFMTFRGNSHIAERLFDAEIPSFVFRVANGHCELYVNSRIAVSDTDKPEAPWRLFSPSAKVRRWVEAHYIRVGHSIGMDELRAAELYVVVLANNQETTCPQQ